MTEYDRATVEEMWLATENLYRGDSNELKEHIALALTRIPDEVRDYLFDNCVIYSIGRETGFGVVWPRASQLRLTRKYPSWVILLSEHLPEGEEEGIIAHEIAHAFLRHNRMSTKLVAECEADAANLAKRWGFKGRGADVKYCSEMYGGETHG